MAAAMRAQGITFPQLEGTEMTDSSRFGEVCITVRHNWWTAALEELPDGV